MEKMDRFTLCIILSSFIPSFICQPAVITDKYTESRSSFPESHPISPYVKSKLDLQSEYNVPSSEYGIPMQKFKLITKNVYIHFPPEEEPEYQPIQTFESQIPKKHYNIIFIKAPTAPTPTAPIIPEPIQDEYKTLVYVLVKKPEPQPMIKLPEIKSTEPTKPEVFFVKYKQDENNKDYETSN